MHDLTQEQIKCVKQLFEEMCDAMEGGKGPSRMWVDPEDADALAAMLAVVERLPVLGDGVRFVQGMTVYDTRYGRIHICEDACIREVTDDGHCALYWRSGSSTFAELRTLFASEAAARAAVEKGGA